MPMWTLWQWGLAAGLPACVLMQLLRGGSSPAMMLVRGLFEWFIVGVASFFAVLVALWLGGIIYELVFLGMWLYLAAAGLFVVFCVWMGLLVLLRMMFTRRDA